MMTLIKRNLVASSAETDRLCTNMRMMIPSPLSAALTVSWTSPALVRWPASRACVQMVQSEQDAQRLNIAMSPGTPGAVAADDSEVCKVVDVCEPCLEEDCVEDEVCVEEEVCAVPQPGFSFEYLWPRGLLLFSSVLYGTNFPLGRIMNDALPPSAATSGRLLFAAVTLSPFLLQLAPKIRWTALLCGCFTAYARPQLTPQTMPSPPLRRSSRALASLWQAGLRHTLHCSR